MKLSEILNFLFEISQQANTSYPQICGGLARDKVLNILKIRNISDVDITTGDPSVKVLAKQFVAELSKKYALTSKENSDGHISIFLGKGEKLLKIDFSSNFIVPGMEKYLIEKGINQPTELQKEMYSRDFTCNSLLMSLDFKNIQEPIPGAMDDIKNKILKTCLSPEVTLTTNPNRVVRIIYLATKLGFEVDKSIIDFVSKYPETIKLSSDQYVKKQIEKSLSYNKEKTIELVNILNLNNYIYGFNFNKTSQLRKNYDYGEGLYSNLDKFKSVSEFRKKRRAKRKKILKNIKDMKLK